VVIHLVTKYPTYRIVNFDKLDYCSSLKNLQCVQHKPNYKFIKVRRRGHALVTRPVCVCGAIPVADPPPAPPPQGSITSPDLVNYVMAEENIDTVLHFAAQTHVGTAPSGVCVCVLHMRCGFVWGDGL